MRLGFIAFCGVFLATGPVDAVYERYRVGKAYGDAARYAVGFSENGMCLAQRTINIRDRDGILRRAGFFAYGIAEYRSHYVAVISIMNPHWNLHPGASMAGKVIVDDQSYLTTFSVSGQSVITATLPESSLAKIGWSKNIRLSTQTRAYKIGPREAAAALPLIVKCVRQSLKTPERQQNLFGGTPPALP